MPISRRSLVASSALLPAIGLIRPALGQEKLKVAGIHTVPVENAWNSRLHQAMVSAAEAGKIEYVFSESVANTDYVRAMRQYADGGARLIVGEVYGVERESRQVAKDYPETGFLMGSSLKEQEPNFGVFGTWNHEAAYLTGMLAAAVSKKNVYGAVGGYPIPEINRLINAFRAGVKEVNPDAKFLVQFIGTFFDPPKAKEAGLAQIDAGADILFGERIGTADAAKDRGILSIGSLLDYSPRYPGTVFANALWNFDPILAAAVADVQAGTPTGKDYSQFSFMRFGGNDISFDPNLVPAEAVAPMEAKRTAIKSGAFEVVIDDSQPA
ncbi:MAG TPA: BMP family protein [Geminicoccus sp.]|jgi:basic membrane lipoprotein Med (substrate-binding protein (PBP1-ABC) superfamily)|uniref:BMP family protein n=1 Tax=Geminicoccus sp. TaxID=2024832 RepID=UPI002E33832D|nr:BMP family protein [Geminicoccus sp.]HEX2527141.1 BMP family protein [Geminicoccus sp.]